MPSSVIYTLGYARWSSDQVERTLQKLGASLIDVRHSPQTSKPGFSATELERRFGKRYCPVPGFGNVNYKGGPIQLADFEDGIEMIRGVEEPLVLMCGCQSPKTCHRSIVAERLQDRRGGSIIHLQSPSKRSQPELFD